MARGGLVGGVFNVSQVSDPDVRATLFNFRWALESDPSQPATTISYSFPTTASVYTPPPAGFAELSPAQKEAVRTSFDLISSYTNLSFVEVDPFADATLRIARASDPSRFGPPAASTGEGDGFFGTNAVVPHNGFVFGTDHFLTIMHELGHGLGLKHGHEDSPNGALASEVNGNEYSVMTYASWIDSPVPPPTAAKDGSAPTSFMMFDIAALQAFYGANLSKIGMRDEYRWDTSGRETINGNAAPATGTTMTSKIFSTIWTQGAVATYDLSNFTGNQFDDLRPGRFLRFSPTQLADLNSEPSVPAGDPAFQARGNIYNTLLFKDDLVSAIANLITGSGDDTLIGNDRDNRLTANAGIDIIFTAGGNDTVSGGPGMDRITFGSGNSILRDTVVDLHGDQVFNLNGRGGVDVLGAQPGAVNLAVTPLQTTLKAGTSTVELYGEFTGGAFLVSQRGVGPDAHTAVAFVQNLPELEEGVAVSDTAINGIASQPFLTGDGTAHFIMEFRAAVSFFANQLGWYTVAADGTIGNVHIGVANTHDPAALGRTFDLGTPANGERIGFFLIQGGATDGPAAGDLTFVLPSGQVANIDFWQAPVLQSASLGQFTDLTVFHSFHSLNPGAAEQVLTGLTDRRELVIGFEDLPHSNGDRDYQDVVIAVYFTPEDNRIV